MTPQIKLTILYTDGTTQTYTGKTFQHGERALTVETNYGSVVAIPESQVKAYEVQKVKAEEPTGQGVMDAEVLSEEDTQQEESDPEKEEV